MSEKQTHVVDGQPVLWDSLPWSVRTAAKTAAVLYLLYVAVVVLALLGAGIALLVIWLVNR